MPQPPSQTRWTKENTFMVSLKLMKRTDQDIIDFLQANETPDRSKQRILKDAMREYMENHK